MDGAVNRSNGVSAGDFSGTGSVRRLGSLLTWAVIPVALAALIKNGPLWQELRASLLKTITRKENVFISWVMRLLIVVSLAWTGWAITLVFYLLTVIAFWITRNQMAQQVAA